MHSRAVEISQQNSVSSSKGRATPCLFYILGPAILAGVTVLAGNATLASLQFCEPSRHFCSRYN